jgi:cell division topological specificity factor MinE
MWSALKSKLFSSGNSKARAKNRLHFVLVQDRAGLGAEQMARFKSELVAVVEKYFVIDKSHFDITYKRESESTCLQINSPVVVRRSDASNSKSSGSSKGANASSGGKSGRK